MQDQPSEAVGFYSVWRTGGVVALISAVATLPLLPNFGTGLHYTAVFYTRFGFPVLVVCCLVGLVIAVSMLPLLVRALRHQPAIEIAGGKARIFAIRTHNFPLSAMRSARKQFLNLVVRNEAGKDVVIPVWLYRRDPDIFALLNVRS